MERYADKIWFGAHIRTMDESLSEAQALASDKNGNILALGSDEDILALKGPKTELFDMNGAWIVPGLLDTHVHYRMYGESLLKLGIRDLSKEDILEKVREAAENAPAGKWIVGGMGWNNEVWADPSYPTREELDEAAPNNPVLLPRMDGHLIWVNSLAFEAAGVTEDTKDPEGGEFMRSAEGKLQGCCSNAAAAVIRGAIPQPGAEERKEAILAAQAQMLAYGLTGISDMHDTPQDLRDVEALYAEGKGKLRYCGTLGDCLNEKDPEENKAFLEKLPILGKFGGRYTVRCCKILSDGAVGAQSAALKEDFSDRPGHKGTLMYTPDELYHMVKTAAEHGLQVATHSIGDAAIDEILDAYEAVLNEIPNPDHRWRIEHFQTVTNDSPQRAARLGVVASMQPMHAPNSASMAMRRLGEKRIHGAYAAGLVMKSTGWVAFGSDAPVSAPSPLSGIHAAVTRTNDQLLPEGGFCMENAVSPMDALKGYTIWAARAVFADDVRGSLEPGKYADFTVLDRDVIEVAETAPHDILKIKVLKTVIGGNCEYKA